jgi:formamidopyrimidine-DNA glycosylase
LPELPEVETIRRELAPRLEGRTFEHVEIHDGRLTRPLDRVETAAELVGERVAHVDRRGKYLLIRFESGRVLVVHLRMTGGFRYSAKEDPYTRAVVHLDNGKLIAYRDVRRFGTWLLLEPGELEAYLDARIGSEPLERAFTAKALAERLAKRRAPLKAVVLDQRVAAGVGNIYADEALWRARLHPLREARTLTPEETKALREGIRKALSVAIERRGSTLRDYRTPDGEPGGMQDRFNVYGRDGEPCPRCGSPIEKTRVGGRGTWYCPQCQR